VYSPLPSGEGNVFNFKVSVPVNFMDPWNKSAQEFYDEFGVKKNAAPFISAYKKILNRIPLSLPLSPFPSHCLDLGCGTGELALVLSQAGAEVTGVDISEKSLARAKSLAPAVKFMEADMTTLPFKEHFFDAAFAMTSLEFCHNKIKALGEIKRVLKPGGFFYVEVRNRGFVMSLILGKWSGLLIRIGLLKAYPAASFEDLSYGEWLGLFGKAGFKLEREYTSLRPWAYGGVLTRTKNLLIELCKFILPLRRQYMAAFMLRPI